MNECIDRMSCHVIIIRHMIDTMVSNASIIIPSPCPRTLSLLPNVELPSVAREKKRRTQPLCLSISTHVIDSVRSFVRSFVGPSPKAKKKKRQRERETDRERNVGCACACAHIHNHVPR